MRGGVLTPINPKPLAHDPGGALMNMGLSSTEHFKRAMAMPLGAPARVKLLLDAIQTRLSERNGWLAVRTESLPAGDLEGAAQASLAISAYYGEGLGDVDNARLFLQQALAQAPAGTLVEAAALKSAAWNGW